MDYGILEAAIRKSIKKFGLQDVNGKFSLFFKIEMLHLGRYFMHQRSFIRFKEIVSLELINR